MSYNVNSLSARVKYNNININYDFASPQQQKQLEKFGPILAFGRINKLFHLC
jgi:hypothetical protein